MLLNSLSISAVTSKQHVKTDKIGTFQTYMYLQMTVKLPNFKIQRDEICIFLLKFTSEVICRSTQVA